VGEQRSESRGSNRSECAFGEPAQALEGSDHRIESSFNDAATTFDQSRPHRSFGEKKENRNSGYLLPMMEFAVEKIRGRP
jgi:hypothetical protein